MVEYSVKVEIVEDGKMSVLNKTLCHTDEQSLSEAVTRLYDELADVEIIGVTITKK